MQNTDPAGIDKRLGKLPQVSLADLPTRLQVLTVDGQKLWVKRDDLTAETYGGNKVRKLEFILADVAAQNKRALVTFGAIGTNHGVATACYCAQQGIDCEVLLFDQPVTEKVRQNLRLMQSFGARLTYCGSMVRTALQFQWRSLWQRDSYFLTAGGSSVLGCVAFVKAAFELAAQLEAGDMPLPDNIVCPAGSLSSCAGLTLGCALAGLSSQVIGVRVAPASVGPIEVCNENKIEQLMRETMHYLVQKGVIKPITLPKPLLLHDYYGEGYGHATAAGERALALFTEHGIALEQTYTAKAAAAALDICESAPDKTVLYWHTFNSVDLRERAQAVPDAAIPENLRRFL